MQKNAQLTAQKEKKKGKALEPVVIEGRKIVNSWWGQAWCENLERLLNGDFPEELKTLFTDENGLFPKPQEISFQCSCPDWALMCKHVAAVLYGIGHRFDENPLLFFELRGIDVGRFVDITIENRI